jgi:hypothetical protein
LNICILDGSFWGSTSVIIMRIRSIVSFFFIFILPANLLALPFSPSRDYPEGHYNHFLNVFEGIEGTNIDNLYKIISTTIDKPFSGLPGNHRNFGHWGFEGDIPFNRDPLKSILESKYPNTIERDLFKQQIKEEWISRVKQLTNSSMALTGLPERQAKSFAGLLYNTHLLGDWRTTYIDPLAKPEIVIDDILKNLHRLFGNNSTFVKDIEKDIASLNKSLSDKLKAEKILEILKKSEIGKNLFETYESFLTKNNIYYRPIGQKYTADALKLMPTSMKSSLKNLTSKLPPSYSTAIKAGAISSIFSGLSASWNVYNNEESASAALTQVFSDTSLSVIGIYLSEGLIQNLGNGKYAITAIIKSGVPIQTAATGALINYGVATFIFDEVSNLYNYFTGGITCEEFVSQTATSALKAAAAGTAAYCTVLLGASAGGPCVMAISIGTYVAVNKVIAKYQEIDSRKYLTYKDILLLYPKGVNGNFTILEINQANSNTLLDLHKVTDKSLLDIDNKKIENSLLDLDNKKSGTLLDE